MPNGANKIKETITNVLNFEEKIVRKNTEKKMEALHSRNQTGQDKYLQSAS